MPLEIPRMSDLANTITIGLVTLLAAFLGAYSAFRLENLARKRREARTKANEGKQAIFTLIKYWNDLAVIRAQFFRPHRDNPARAIAVMPVAGFTMNELRLNTSGLTFLIDEGEGTLLNQLLVEEDRVCTLDLVIKQRSDLHLNQVQPALFGGGIREGQGITRQQAVDALGEPLFLNITRLTDDVYDSLDNTLISISESIDELRTVLRRLFPGVKFPTFEPNPDYV